MERQITHEDGAAVAHQHGSIPSRLSAWRRAVRRLALWATVKGWGNHYEDFQAYQKELHGRLIPAVRMGSLVFLREIYPASEQARMAMEASHAHNRDIEDIRGQLRMLHESQAYVVQALGNVRSMPSHDYRAPAHFQPRENGIAPEPEEPQLRLHEGVTV